MKEQIACLVLGAGFGRRYGGDKALAPWSGKTVGESVLRAVSAVDFCEVVVVRREGQAALSLPKGESLRVIQVPDAEAAKGLHFSLCAGLRALERPWDWLCITLLDQPLLAPEHFNQLLAFTEGNHENSLIMPLGTRGRGNPAIIHRSYREEILSEEGGDFGCGYLFHRYPQNILALASNDRAYYFDVDEPGDLVNGNHSPTTI
jgi:molybdenum cofactor cytidylyltransferase